MKRNGGRISKIERAYKLLQYLKKNSDKDHTIMQKDLRGNFEIEKYVGDKETYNDTITKLAMTMNFDEYGIKPDKDWRIVFNDFTKNYGSKALEKEESDVETLTSKMRIRGLYYNPIFTYEEINYIIEAILFSKTIDSATADILIKKIEENLTSKYYKKNHKIICKVKEIPNENQKLLRENLLTIQNAIDRNVQISFIYNQYNHDKVLVPKSKNKVTVSPYYFVVNEGKYFLVACKEVVENLVKIRKLTVWRVDLLTEVEIPLPNEKYQSGGIPSIDKSKVENFTQDFSILFSNFYENVTLDKPTKIQLKISNKNSSTDFKNTDYTFMYDRFGKEFKYLYTEKFPPYKDVVEVKCSPYVMVDLALQYSDKVEVVEPEFVREMIVDTIKELIKKYIGEL